MEIKPNPIHSKALSEDLGQTAFAGQTKISGGQGSSTFAGTETPDKGQRSAKSIWMSSTSSMPLFFYQSSKSPDKMEVVAEQLNENLNLEGDSSSPHI
jgi:hypothetical protein